MAISLGIYHIFRQTQKVDRRTLGMMNMDELQIFIYTGFINPLVVTHLVGGAIISILKNDVVRQWEG